MVEEGMNIEIQIPTCIMHDTSIKEFIFDPYSLAFEIMMGATK